MGDALLFATMCLVGLPVEVQVKDGSVYSGIFYTARFDKGFGIVLKKAQMIQKGKCNANLDKETLVETLVVLSGDLVQVVAKGVLHPAEGIVGGGTGDNVETVDRSFKRLMSNAEPERETKPLTLAGTNSERRCPQDEEYKSSYHTKRMGSEDVTIIKEPPVRMGLVKTSQSVVGIENMKMDSNKKMEEALQLPTVTVSESADRQAGKDNTYNKEAVLHSTTNLNSENESPITQRSATYEISGHALPKKNSNEARCGEIQNGSMLASPSVSEASTTSTSTAPCVPVPSKTSACKTNTKKFKLNPGAKTFSPSFANPRTATPAMSSAASMGYASNIPPVLPVSQPGIEISPLSSRPSLPVKFVNYNNLVTGHSDINSQIPHTIIGHAGSRQQPIRPGPGYPLQAAPTYMHPNCQTVMVGRFGHLMYVHPMTHDAIPGATVLAQGSPLPLMTPHQAHLPKSQGAVMQALPLCLPPPLVAGVQQPLVMPSHAPFSPHFPATIRPIAAVPGSNGIFCSKF
ncbi:hypothetical protein QJS10_CPA09g01198 [Acorus calamus]|uniref:Ataxin 2 SM domain-containing protein n=1 Tax=Acorus calamus TaxID=4465 RepID=A0AAV9E5Q8_ACOCL|nr:hypothetical protein QJS10_CPA09g01198 [Acorus calamus]